MSNIIPPLLSNSPPPMVGVVIDDEDDEFGNFPTVHNFSYDDDGLSLSTPEEINIKELPEIPHAHTVDKDFQDKRKNDADTVDVHEESDEDDKLKYNSFQYFPEMPPDIPEDDELVNDQEVASVTHDENQFISNFNTLESTSLPEAVDDKVDPELTDEDDFADFNAFTNISPVDLNSENVNEDNVAQDIENDDDDFGDFNDYSKDIHNLQSDIDGIEPERAENVVITMFPNIEQNTEEFYEENFISNDILFCKLKDITDTLALSYQWNKSRSQNFLLQALNIDTRNILYGPRWNETMPRYAATLGYTPLEPLKSEAHNGSNGEATSSHSELVEQMEIPLAEFDWVGSGLTNPLEMTPKKIIEKQAEQSQQISENKKLETFSTAQLQANSDTDSIKSLKLMKNTGSDKADDDFDDFTSFQSVRNENDQINCFQSNKNENEHFDSWPTLRDTQITNINQSCKNNDEHFENWTSLRETHISNAKVEEPNWLKPTIVTPDLPRKGNTCEPQFEEDEEEEEDEFTDYQTGDIQQTTIPEMQNLKIEESNMPSLKIENNSFTEDENFSKLQSTSFSPSQLPIISEPLQPLQPSILQPTKVENAPTTINWPNPGVTDEELQRFDIFFKPSVASTVESSKLNNSGTDEDDWSDFVSNQTTQSLDNQINTKIPTRNEVAEVQNFKREEFLVKPPIPFSQNGYPTSLVSNQYIVLNHMPTKTDEVEDEWSDFVSSQPPPESPNRVPKPISKLNLDWNGPPQFTSWSTSITPNIITNPVSFESFQNFTPLDTDLLKNRNVSKKNPSIIQPKKSTVSSISTVPDLEFIAPKNRTWKK